MNLQSLAFWKRVLAASAQSKDRPVPPTAVAVRESTSTASILGSGMIEAAFRSGFGAKVHHAQDAQVRSEVRAKLSGQIGRGVEVQLDAGEPADVDCGFDFFKRCIDEDADLFEGCWQMGHDGGDLCWRDAARAGRKHKSHRVGASFGRKLRILKRGVAADFDPEFGSSSYCGSCQQVGQRGAGVGLAHQAFADQEGVKSGRAQPGNVSVGMRCRSRLRAPRWKECAQTRASEVSRLTSKVFRSRLLTPMASAPYSPKRIEHAVELAVCVHFDEHVERKSVGDIGADA